MYQETERTRRVGALIKREVADIILRELDDAELRLVSITGATVSRDLRRATVFFTVIGKDRAHQEIGERLNEARGFIRRRLGARVRLKRTPDLDFRFDESVGKGFEMSRLIDSLSVDQSGN
jgi:ribosome-binding factor A